MVARPAADRRSLDVIQNEAPLQRTTLATQMVGSGGLRYDEVQLLHQLVGLLRAPAAPTAVVAQDENFSLHYRGGGRGEETAKQRAVLDCFCTN